MNKQHLKCLLIITILLGTQLHASARTNNTTASLPSSEDVILQWNRVLMGTIRTPGQQPPTIFPLLDTNGNPNSEADKLPHRFS